MPGAYREPRVAVIRLTVRREEFHEAEYGAKKEHEERRTASERAGTPAKLEGPVECSHERQAGKPAHERDDPGVRVG